MNDADLDRLYALLPRAKRGRLHDRLIHANSAFPYKGGPDAAPPGQYFAVAVGDNASPASRQSLSAVLRAVSRSTQNDPNPDKRYSYEQLRDPAGAILQQYLHEEGLLNEDEDPINVDGGRRRRKARKHMTRRKRAGTRRRRHGRSRRA